MMVVVCLFFDYMRYNYCPTTERIRAMAVIAVLAFSVVVRSGGVWETTCMSGEA